MGWYNPGMKSSDHNWPKHPDGTYKTSTEINDEFLKGMEDDGIMLTEAQAEALVEKALSLGNDFTLGNILKGKVVGKAGEDAVIDIGLMSKGLIHKSEFDDWDTLESGTEIEVVLEDLEDENGDVRLSHIKALRLRNFEAVIDEAHPSTTLVQRRVKWAHCDCVGRNGKRKNLYQHLEEANIARRDSESKRNVSLEVYACDSGTGWHLRKKRDKKLSLNAEANKNFARMFGLPQPPS